MKPDQFNRLRCLEGSTPDRVAELVRRRLRENAEMEPTMDEGTRMLLTMLEWEVER